MDGNSTNLVVVEFLSNHSDAFLSIAQLGTAVVLAYFTIKLYQATAKYANLVESQNEMINEQIKKMESHNLIMESQNLIMHENRDYDLMIKKYNRMLDEMKNLVAPLYARRNDPIIFTREGFDSKVKCQSMGHCIVENPVNRDFYEFWEDIYRNLYLNQSTELQACLNKYPGFKVDRRKLVTIIEYRYNELTNQISDIESELGIRASSMQVSDSIQKNTSIRDSRQIH